MKLSNFTKPIKRHRMSKSEAIEAGIRHLPPNHRGKGSKHLSEELIGRMLKVTLGHRTETARRLGCSAVNIFQRIRGSAYLQNVVEEIYNGLVDDAEQTIHKKVNKENLKASMFTLERLAKGRGWTKKSDEVEDRLPQSLTINIQVAPQSLPGSREMIELNPSPKQIEEF